jgi:hypothetical protein
MHFPAERASIVLIDLPLAGDNALIIAGRLFLPLRQRRIGIVGRGRQSFCASH